MMACIHSITSSIFQSDKKVEKVFLLLKKQRKIDKQTDHKALEEKK